jgi:hypothetical protein
MKSHFITRGPPRRPERFVPAQLGPPQLQRQVDVRPGQFVVGLDEDVSWDDLPVTPINPAVYLGRVEEVTREGLVVATLWERPSGREAIATLSVDDDFGRDAPSAGDLLRIRTWVEICEGGETRARSHVKVETQQLSSDERAELKRVRDALERQLEEPDAKSTDEEARETAPPHQQEAKAKIASNEATAEKGTIKTLPSTPRGKRPPDKT